MYHSRVHTDRSVSPPIYIYKNSALYVYQKFLLPVIRRDCSFTGVGDDGKTSGIKFLPILYSSLYFFVDVVVASEESSELRESNAEKRSEFLRR